MQRRCVWLCGLLLAGAGFAQTLPPLSLEQHTQRLLALRTLVLDCEADPAKCSASAVGPDEKLKFGNGTETYVDYKWLRTTIDAMAKVPPDARRRLADLALGHLAMAGPEMRTGVSEADARKTANAILSTPEFQPSQPGWLESHWDRAMRWLFQHLSLPDVGPSRASWVRFLVEVFLFAVPLVVLVVWLRRQMKEDRILPQSSRAEKRGETVSVSWSREAQACAERAEWRDAIHALFWQSITSFEERKIWPVTRTRTPREYLALLDPGSPRRMLLREQTLLLESRWYGNRPATEADYQRCLQLAAELSLA